VRKEYTVELTPHGELIEEGHKDEPEDTAAASYCEWDYVMGVEKSNDCQTTDNATYVNGRDECEEAAQLSGATVLHLQFEVNDAVLMNKRPNGCFKAPCHPGHSEHVCYFFNDKGTPSPDQIEFGTPVCRRHKHKYGGPNTNGGCAEGYTVVDDRQICKESAKCMALVPSMDFDVGTQPNMNQSKHLDFPRGCFKGDDLLAYYNPPNEMGNGTNVTGTPICAVTTPLHWGDHNAAHAIDANATSSVVNATR